MLESINILLLDDDLHILDSVRMNLSSLDEYRVFAYSDARDAIANIEGKDYAVVITDVDMPGMNGLQLLQWMKDYDATVPVILITGSQETDILMEAIRYGAYDFLKKPFSLSDLAIILKRAVEKHRLLKQNVLHHNHLESMVEARTRELNQTTKKLEMSYLNTIRAMINAMEINDEYTHGHSERVAAISLLIGSALELSKEEMDLLRIGALLHDLGKIGITTQILHKDQSLTDTEYDDIKLHPIKGLKIVEPIGLSPRVKNIILQHHERYDGSGYPFGIDNSQIDFLAAIVSVADSFDAMISNRPYRLGVNTGKAKCEICQQRAKQFHPEVVDAFEKIQKQIFKTLESPAIVKELLTEV
ncbi:MAG: HD domain-containing phosphohydrolase [Candidatus Cloacimonadaceae bacterium]